MQSHKSSRRLTALGRWFVRHKALLSLVTMLALCLVLIGFAVWQLSRDAVLNATVIASFAVFNMSVAVLAYLKAE